MRIISIYRCNQKTVVCPGYSCPRYSSNGEGEGAGYIMIGWP